MTNTGLINSFNEVNNFLIFLRNEYATAAEAGNLTSGDLTAAVKMNEQASTDAEEASKGLTEREFEKIQEEVNIDKEILGALPKNGIRANSKYAQRIEEVAAKYYVYKDKFYNEAKRRYDEYIAKGKQESYDDILESIKQRDYNDSHREIAPLTAADDAVTVDTSDDTPQQSVERIVKIIEEKVV